ncbi:hypothetical protein L1049_027019 [Liquidambar formosana]|uniref:Uncharacterized protein n=1 Tax=Liquidambar formosana TaxID=63359 RepID=A0AAP0NEE9_LIQFO
MNLQVMPLLSKSESADEKPTCNSVNFGTPSCLETGLKQPKQQDAPPFERKSETAFSPATAVGSQQEQPHAIKENKKNSPSLWPGLSSAGSHGGGSNGPSLQFYNAKTPAWLDTATCATRPGSSENGVSIEKVSGVTVDRKSWKRCAAHVYISRLIQVLQISERKERLPIQPNQLRPM